MNQNLVEYVKNLKVNERKFMQISLGLTLIGGAIIATSMDNVIGITLVTGGVYCANVAQDYRNIEEAIICENEKVKKL